jgi:hypothetical protein
LRASFTGEAIFVNISLYVIAVVFHHGFAISAQADITIAHNSQNAYNNQLDSHNIIEQFRKSQNNYSGYQ